MTSDLVEQLIYASANGELNEVQSLILQGCSVDSVDEDENTLLQIASANGHENIVRFLITKGASLDKGNMYGWTSLLQASRYGHTGIVSLLIHHQVDINSKSHLSVGALMLACRGGHLQTVKLLVDSGASLGIAGNACTFTPLFPAAFHGQDSVLRFLLGRGCDANYCTSSSRLTPLMLAAVNGHMTTAQILIEHGADTDCVSVNSCTALDMAIGRCRKDVAGYLERLTRNKCQMSTDEIRLDIVDAAKAGNIDVVKQILMTDRGQKDVCTLRDGATPLMFAAMLGHRNIVETLVQSGCNVDKQDEVSGWTALMQAVYHRRKHVAMYLLSAGADASVRAKNGCTAFDLVTLIDDADTDLLRTLASKTLQVKQVSKHLNGPGRNHSNVVTRFLSMSSRERTSKNGLKSWWHRMSNRFHNLKHGKTSDGHLASIATPPSVSLSAKAAPLNDALSSERANPSILPFAGHCTYALKSVTPPPLPPPAFSLDSFRPPAVIGADRVAQKSSASPTQQAYPTNYALSVVDTERIMENVATSVTSRWRRPALLFKSCEPPLRPSAFRPTPVNTSPNSSAPVITSNSSSTSRISFVAPQRSSKSCSTASKGSTSPTLTPSPSPTPDKCTDAVGGVGGASRSMMDCRQDELSYVLQKLSLERYHPVFEQQEVDMEAFLMLTEEDLREIGVSSFDARKKILQAITELNSTKHRERQLMMTSLNLSNKVPTTESFTRF